MLSNILLAAFATLVPLSCASTVPTDFVLARRMEEIDAVAGDDLILDAFIEADHPDASPNRTMDEYGDLDLYSFDETEWQAMRTSLLQKAGIDESAVATRDLDVRAPAPDDPPAFFCDNLNTHPKAYTASLSAAAAGFCQAVVSGTAALGRRQVARRPDQAVSNGGAIRTTLTFLAKSLKWATASGCGIGMSIGVNSACESIGDGFKGEQQVSRGFTAEDDEVAVSIALRRV